MPGRPRCCCCCANRPRIGLAGCGPGAGRVLLLGVRSVILMRGGSAMTVPTAGRDGSRGAAGASSGVSMRPVSGRGRSALRARARSSSSSNRLRAVPATSSTVRGACGAVGSGVGRTGCTRGGRGVDGGGVGAGGCVRGISTVRAPCVSVALRAMTCGPATITRERAGGVGAAAAGAGAGSGAFGAGGGGACGAGAGSSTLRVSTTTGAATSRTGAAGRAGGGSGARGAGSGAASTTCGAGSTGAGAGGGVRLMTAGAGAGAGASAAFLAGAGAAAAGASSVAAARRRITGAVADTAGRASSRPSPSAAALSALERRRSTAPPVESRCVCAGFSPAFSFSSERLMRATSSASSDDM